MTESSVSIFHNSVSFAKAEQPEGTGPVFRYHGLLTEVITLDDLDDEFVTVISVAVREGAALVTLRYNTGATETFTVTPGFPLLYQTRSNETFLADPTIEKSGTDRCNAEVMVYTGTTPLNPADPAYLILDAGSGITEDQFNDNSVTAWKDSRAVSSAPLDFDWSSSAVEATLIDSDPDFGGKPSVSFPSGSGAAASFGYSGLNTVFDFMDGSSDFTLMMITSVPDDASSTNSATASGQGLWNTSSSNSNNGLRALVEGGYRTQTLLVDGSVEEDEIGSEELAEKPTVMIWRYDASASELRIYWQGRWHPALAFDGTSGTNTVLQVGVAYEASGAARFFRGKIANLTLYDRAVESSVTDGYLSSATIDYGIDDTEENGFPWISSCVNMHRANRGLNWQDDLETELTVWRDTREELNNGVISTDAQDFVPIDPEVNSPTYSAVDLVLGKPSLVFDGTDDALTNSFTGTSGDHLGGSAMTITIVFYLTGNIATIRGLFTMGDYSGGYDSDDAALDGTNINLANGTQWLEYHIDNGADDDVLNEDGSVLAISVPYAVVLRSDGASYWIDEVNLNTGAQVTQKTAALGAAESSTTSASVNLFAFSSFAAGFCEGGLAEVTTAASKQTNTKISEFFEYAKARYGT